eukprot:760795-Pyramimonas_sp.AAC.1
MNRDPGGGATRGFEGRIWNSHWPRAGDRKPRASGGAPGPHRGPSNRRARGRQRTVGSVQPGCAGDHAPPRIPPRAPRLGKFPPLPALS